MLDQKYKKRSFLKLPVAIDSSKLLQEFNSIPAQQWASSYWGATHCSVGMLLLRGGNSGTEADFYSEEVHDNPLLDQLPYIRNLISNKGPFGGAKYAFIFRMLPNGITIAHQDLREEWFDMYRVHVPIITNDEAVLISDGYAIHFPIGEAWTFDNYSLHGVVNGQSERTHLIFDVPFNDVMANCIDEADYHQGHIDKNKLEIISTKEKAIASYPGDAAILQTMITLKSYGFDNLRIAEFLNTKEVPTKKYGGTWDEHAVRELMPAIFM